MNKLPIIELSEDLKNKISAGEVVERPFNVVKELVENSLDANASKIKIELTDAGIKKIIVTDNGYGMTEEEIPMALKRHATSKITTVDDLFAITTLGFRGEALPSIATISYFTITSSTNSLDGYRYFYEGGILKEKAPSSMMKGTKIEVENLFYNTPARLKHLSSFNQELSHTSAFITKMALARTDVSFTLINNGRMLLQTLGNSDILEVINEVYGSDVCKNLIEFKSSNDLYEISGFTTNNSINRSNKNSINLIVNGRIIRNASLVYAITDAYKSILPEGKYPVTILKINCDPSIIDVNIHPSKLEIKFTDEANLKQLITKTIYLKLVKKEMIIDELDTNSKISNPTKLQETTQSTLLEADETKKTEQLVTEDLWAMFDDAIVEVPKYENKEENEILKEDESIEYHETEAPSLFKEEKHIFFQNFTYLGQYAKTYLLMEYNYDLYLIDQHAAMERFMYEKISKDFASPTHSTYELLVPIKLDFNLQTMLLILEKKDELEKLGIAFEEFGPNTILVRSVPLWIPDDQVIEFLNEIIEQLINNKEANKQIMYDSLAKMLSCKKSIKANMSISDIEVRALMKKLDECDFPYTCPHGRPTIIKFTKYEIEKMFKRVM